MEQIPKGSANEALAAMLEAKKAEIQALLAALPQYAHTRCVHAAIDNENYLLRVGSPTDG